MTAATGHPTPRTSHHHDHRPTRDHHAHAADLPDLLDLDAQVLGSYLPTVTAWAAAHLAEDPRTVLDLGTGTGTGALALAERFPDAQVHALDRSPTMLERVTQAARSHGLADRIHPVEADLDHALPDLEPADLAWASSSLHEVADTSRTLRAVHDALRPGGSVVVVEMHGLPRLLPDDRLPDGHRSRPRGLEARMHAALAAAGWNPVPDWTALLQEAGLDLVVHRHFPVVAGPGHPRAEEYARMVLRHQRAALADTLPEEDLATLDQVLADHGPTSPLAGPRLTVRAARAAWLARRA